MSLALTAPTQIDIVPPAIPVRWPVRSNLRLLRRRVRRIQLAWRFIGRDRRMLDDVGIASASSRAFLADFLRR